MPLHTNYGGILQAYALQTVFERFGYEVWIIEAPRVYTLPWYKKPLSYCKRIVQKYLLNKNIAINQEKKNQQEKIVVQSYTRKFIDKYLHLKRYDSLGKIREKDFDIYVVGSDQIWRPKYVKRLISGKIENVFLDFTGKWNVKRIAYAASFGTDIWEYTRRQTENCRRGITMFDAVSVRESSGVALCREKFNVQAELVLDPTLLLSMNDYTNLTKDLDYKINGDLMAYVLDENSDIRNLIDKVATKKGWKIFNCNKKVDDKSLPVQNRIQPPVENWLIGFRDAEFVITDSFHACVFSIIFNKPFLVVGNTERGLSRFQSLLTMFGQGHRMIQNIDDFKLEDRYFNRPDVDIDEYRKTSLAFLNKSLTYDTTSN